MHIGLCTAHSEHIYDVIISIRSKISRDEGILDFFCYAFRYIYNTRFSILYRMLGK